MIAIFRGSPHVPSGRCWDNTLKLSYGGFLLQALYMIQHYKNVRSLTKNAGGRRVENPCNRAHLFPLQLIYECEHYVLILHQNLTNDRCYT
jgi:hypothetical protein